MGNPVKLPPKNPISMMLFSLGRVLRWLATFAVISSSRIACCCPVLFRWLQNTQSKGQPCMGMKSGMVKCFWFKVQRLKVRRLAFGVPCFRFRACRSAGHSVQSSKFRIFPVTGFIESIIHLIASGIINRLKVDIP